MESSRSQWGSAIPNTASQTSNAEHAHMVEGIVSTAATSSGFSVRPSLTAFAGRPNTIAFIACDVTQGDTALPSDEPTDDVLVFAAHTAQRRLELDGAAQCDTLLLAHVAGCLACCCVARLATVPLRGAAAAHRGSNG